MPWGAAIAAVAATGSAAMSSRTAKKAAKTQAASAMEGMVTEERMFERGLELQEPYREAGYGALEGLQGLTDQDYRAEQLQGYYAGPEYAQMAQQVEGQQMRNAAVTGGVRGGSNQVALASIAPQLGQQYLSGLNQQYTGLANMGMGAASQGSGQAMQLGGNISNLQQQAGQAAAQNQIAQANIWGNAVSDVGALGYDYFNKGK